MRLFAAEGAKVIVADILASDAETVAADIRSGDGEATAAKIDVTNEAECQAAGSLAMLLATACATPPAPQVATPPPPGQARIWFYRL